jgi:hypothetical protein
MLNSLYRVFFGPREAAHLVSVKQETLLVVYRRCEGADYHMIGLLTDGVFID